MHKTVFSGHNLEMHIKAHAGKRLTNADIEEIVTNISLRNVVREQKRDYVGKIPKLRGGVWPKPTPYFSLLFPIQELIKWHNKFYKNGKKMWKFPNWGGGWGGSAAWEFFPHNPVFCFWQRSLVKFTFVWLVNYCLPHGMVLSIWEKHSKRLTSTNW